LKNIVGVKFKKEGKIYTFHAADLPLKRDDLVVVITDNGPAIGTVAKAVKAG
jgi:cell fate regulator YaaT (PSP1 superfamily)